MLRSILKTSWHTKTVNPFARRFIPVPETTWSALNVIEANAWISEKSPPVSAASASASGMERPVLVSKITCIIAAVIAPIDINPSSAIFTTPERSQIIPPIAAIKIGATIINVEANIPITALPFPLFLSCATQQATAFRREAK